MKEAKYLAIARWIRENIENNHFKPGDKLISENQLCERFGISRQTARQAVSLLEKEGLVTRKQGSGTYINNTPLSPSVSTRNIGLLITYWDEYIFPSIISGIEKVLSKNNYNMILRLTRNQVDHERSHLKSLLEYGVDGLIIEGTKTALPNPNLDLYQQFHDRGIPVIFINAYYPDMAGNYIVNDDITGAQIATNYLIEKGHTKISGIFKHDDAQGKERYKGFMDAMYEHDLPVNEQSILWYSTESFAEQFSLEQIPLFLKKLGKSTAMICYNDQITMKLIQLFTQNQVSLPEGFTFVSFDNSPLGTISPIPFSSITHPGKVMGNLAADSILNMISNPQLTVRHVFTPELIVREAD